MTPCLCIAGFVEWVDGAMPLSKIISEYATTNQMLAKVNQECIKATLASQVRTNLVVNSDIGIAFPSGRPSSTRAVRRLSSAASRDCDRIPQTVDKRSRSSSGGSSEGAGKLAEDSNKHTSRSGRHSSVGFDQQSSGPTSQDQSGELPPGPGDSPSHEGKNIDSPIHNYLRFHNPSSGFYDLFGIDSSAMHSYVGTVAGSCVLTYVLGESVIDCIESLHLLLRRVFNSLTCFL